MTCHDGEGCETQDLRHKIVKTAYLIVKKRPHLFIADDNSGDVSLLLQGFTDCNVEVDITHAHDGDEVIQHMEGDSSQFDLAVLDYYLPKKTGVEVTRLLQLNARLPKCPVVMLTSLPLASQSQELKLAGIREILTKPSDLDGYGKLAKRLLDLITGTD